MKRFGEIDSEMKDFKKYPIYDEELRNANNEAFKAYQWASLIGCSLY
jgi:hypothetical protein